MSWTIDRHGRVAVVTMTTNPVNARNRQFFADLHQAFDILDDEHPDSLDTELPHWFTTPDARHAHRRYWTQLKGRPATW